MFDSLNASRLFPALLEALENQCIVLTAPPGGGKSTFLRLFSAYAQSEYHCVYFSAASANTNLSAALLYQLGDLDTQAPRDARIQRILEQHPKLLLLIDNLDTLAAEQCRIFLAELRHAWPVPQVIAATPALAAQLPNPLIFPLHYYDDHALAGFLPHENTSYVRMLVELLDYNPGRLQHIWQQANISMARLYRLQHSVQGFVHQPNIALMLKWLLLRDYLRENPYAYFALEKAPAEQRQEVLQKNYPDLPTSLRAFILRDVEHCCFDKPRVLSLYIEANGDKLSRSALSLNIRRLQGQTAFDYWDLSCVDFSGESLTHLHFHACDFSFSDFCGADLRHTVFDNCELHGARFDSADVGETHWQGCLHLESLCTEVDTYQLIANRALQSWQAQPDWPPEALYKMYKTMFNRLAENDPQRQRIMDKGVQVRRLMQNQTQTLG